MKKCTYCGRANLEEAAQCQECSTEFFIPKWPEDKWPSAGFMIRAFARIIDTLFGLCLGFSAGRGARTIFLILNGAGYLPVGWQRHLHGFSLANFGCSLLGVLLYHTLCEGLHGATIGKLCCGICVVSEDGQPSTLKGALIRNLGFYVDAIFLGALGYASMEKSPINQRYGDR